MWYAESTTGRLNPSKGMNEMEIKMGEKIKTLRKQKNISQEVLAQVLGVSFQAVSKWETGACMPDVTMIPAIAGFFEVSTDELFDFNLIEQENKVMDIVGRAADIRWERPAEAEEILRQGLKQFPGNEILLNNLLYTMRAPERNEEVVTLCKSILEVTKIDECKYDVLRILAETYHAMGYQALVGPTLEQIPEIYFTKLELMANLLEGEEALKAAVNQANISRFDLISMTARASKLYRERGEMEKAEDYARLARAAYDLFKDREDHLGFTRYEQEELAEEVWPLLEG